jgi:hypothetical protein
MVFTPVASLPLHYISIHHFAPSYYYISEQLLLPVEEVAHFPDWDLCPSGRLDVETLSLSEH